MHHLARPHHRATPWALAIGLLLSACGGGSDDTGTTPPPPTPPVVGSATGVLTDAAVQGVAYSASPSGATGTTDALGQFRYNPGDSVNFSLGGLTLASNVPAAALVTPVELAGGSTDKLRNLLVLLQSLDQDGNAGNGITISATTAAAVTAGVDLAQAPATFAAAGNAALTAAMAAGGITRAITSGAAADTHFLGQATALLASQVWVGRFENDAVVVVQRFGSNGTQLNAQIGPAEDGGSSGLEYGTVQASAVDARGFAINPVLEIDTNGTWGLSHLSACERVAFPGGLLTYREAPASCVTDTSTTLSKADNEPGGLVGVWAVESATELKTQTLVFWKDGRFAMVDPVGDDQPNSCGGPGVEFGTYSYNATTLAFKVLTISFDTNGCAGLSDVGGTGLASFDISIDTSGNTATAAASDGTFKLYRISR